VEAQPQRRLAVRLGRRVAQRDQAAGLADVPVARPALHQAQQLLRHHQAAPRHRVEDAQREARAGPASQVDRRPLHRRARQPLDLLDVLGDKVGGVAPNARPAQRGAPSRDRALQRWRLPVRPERSRIDAAQPRGGARHSAALSGRTRRAAAVRVARVSGTSARTTTPYSGTVTSSACTSSASARRWTPARTRASRRNGPSPRWRRVRSADRLTMAEGCRSSPGRVPRHPQVRSTVHDRLKCA